MFSHHAHYSRFLRANQPDIIQTTPLCHHDPLFLFLSLTVQDSRQPQTSILIFRLIVWLALKKQNVSKNRVGKLNKRIFDHGLNSGFLEYNNPKNWPVRRRNSVQYILQQCYKTDVSFEPKTTNIIYILKCNKLNSLKRRINNNNFCSKLDLESFLHLTARFLLKISWATLRKQVGI